MKPTKAGQIARFHTPYPDENPNQLYVVLEIIEYNDTIKPKADIKALNTGLSFAPINTVLLEDLEVVEVDTTDLIGYKAAVKKQNGSLVTGRVTKVEKTKQLVDLEKIENRVETNVHLTIKDASGIQHEGTLAVIF